MAGVLRAAGGFSSRANSALVSGSPGLPLETAVEAVLAFPGVADGDAGDAFDRLLQRRGALFDLHLADHLVAPVQDPGLSPATGQFAGMPHL